MSVRFAHLRDGVRWDANRTALSIDADGALRLTRIAAPEDPVHLPLSPAPGRGGLAVDGCGRVFVSETTPASLRMHVPSCAHPFVSMGDSWSSLVAPAALAAFDDMLFVADSSQGCVFVLRLPSMEVRRSIGAGLVEPIAVAVDRHGRLYVVDRYLKRVRRFSAAGTPDSIFDAAIAAHPEITVPIAITCLDDESVAVIDEATGQVLIVDESDGLVGMLALPAGAPPIVPTTLAARRGVVVVADAASGEIVWFDALTRTYLGSTPDFNAPVQAMAFAVNGDLLVKIDSTGGWLTLAAAAGCAAAGRIVAGPLDAGVASNWERVTVDCAASASTEVTLEIVTSAAAAPPVPGAWRPVPAVDALIAAANGPDPAKPGDRRYLWIRVEVLSGDGRHSPAIAQVRAHTVEPSYLDQLPRIYRRDDGRTRLVERILALGRAEMDDFDAELDGLFRRLDPARAPAEGLPWIGDVLALPLAGADVATSRARLGDVPAFYARRGTIDGVCDAAERVAGVRPHVFEAFQSRRLWVLDETSRVGIDTALAAADADGLVVPGHLRTDPAYRGLAGDYYAGFEFERAVAHRVDRAIEFAAGHSVVPSENGLPLDRYSIRWSGQIKPRFSEVYSLFMTPDVGVRLWVDGALLIDTWSSGRPAAGAPRVTLDAERWSAITCELHRVDPAHDPTALLEWSSRSQLREPVPADCLYSVLDDRADLDPPDTTVEIGQAIVGATGPATASEYGAGLFADYAHLFAVVVPAARVAPARRAALRDAIESEKPAHTDYHLCLPEARMRVGFQARLGIDAIVALGPPPMHVGEAALGETSYLADAPPGGARVGARARVGRDTVVG